MTAVAGLNLRQEDIPGFVAACQAAGVNPGDIPALVTLHDDDEATARASLQAFINAGIKVTIIRFYSDDRRYFDIVPPDGEVIGWNENGNGGPESLNPDLPGWVDPWQQAWKANRPDVTRHYGAPNVNGLWRENTALEAAMDAVDRHIGSAGFPVPPATIQGRPTTVTEIDIDPSRFQQTIVTDSYPWGTDEQMFPAYNELCQTMQACVAAGVSAFAWGIQPYVPDAAYAPKVLQAIVQINAQSQGEKPMASPSPDTLQQQNGLNAQATYKLANALVAVAEQIGDPGKSALLGALFDGAESTFGQLNAVNPSAFPVPARPQ